MTKNTKIYEVLKINIHGITIQSLEFLLKELLESNNSVNQIITFNIDFLRITTIDKEFNQICKNSFMNLPDGYGIIYIIEKKYKEKIDRITGNDIYLLLIKLAKKLNKKIAIIGGTESVSKKTEHILLSQYNIVPNNLLCISPEYKFEENDFVNSEIIEKIRLFSPDIVFAALGCPRQEKWLYKNMKSFGSTINVGIGATLDFFTKEKKRSPLFLQNLGLEWLWRLLHEPRRLFNRYIVKDLPFFLKIYFSKNL